MAGVGNYVRLLEFCIVLVILAFPLVLFGSLFEGVDASHRYSLTDRKTFGLHLTFLLYNLSDLVRYVCRQMVATEGPNKDVDHSRFAFRTPWARRQPRTPSGTMTTRPGVSVELASVELISAIKWMRLKAIVEGLPLYANERPELRSAWSSIFRLLTDVMAS